MTIWRITSTYVENTGVQDVKQAIAEDHLHIRGEYYSGSGVEVRKIRITSTYVENTNRRLVSGNID